MFHPVHPYVKGDIEGVVVKNLKVHFDDRGCLFEALRTDWNEVSQTLNSPDNNSSRNINQIYFVRNTSDAIRAYHKHTDLIDFFTIVNGTAKFVLIDDRPKSKTYRNYKSYNLFSEQPQVLVIPAGIYHGWKADKGTMLLSSANDLYMGENHLGKLDEVRIPWNTIGEDVWKTEFK